MLRLKPRELAAMLPEWTVVRSAEIDAGSYWNDLNKRPHPIWTIAKQAMRVAVPVYRPHQWRANASRLSWLFCHYRASLVLLQKP
jgi:hypothetical protein